MKTVFRITGSMLIVLISTFIISGCATTRQAAKPDSPPDTAAAAREESKKIIVAKANDVELTMDEFVKVMNSLPDLDPLVSETLEDRKKRALDHLVLRELAFQRATALGLNADPVKLESEIDAFKLNIGGEKEFAEYLTKHNFTEEDVRAETQRGLSINNIYTREVVDRVEVPEEDLKQEYEKEKHRLINQEKVTVIDVYLLKDEGKASQARAKQLLKKIKADPKQDPWKLVLDGTFMVKNMRVRKDREKELYNAAKKLKPQKLSGVVRDSKGILHIMKLKEYSPEKQLTFDEAKPAMIQKLNAPFIEKRTREWEQELKTGAKIELFPEVLGLAPQAQKPPASGQAEKNN
jgi:hypothetical protein